MELDSADWARSGMLKGSTWNGRQEPRAGIGAAGPAGLARDGRAPLKGTGRNNWRRSIRPPPPPPGTAAPRFPIEALRPDRHVPRRLRPASAPTYFRSCFRDRINYYSSPRYQAIQAGKSSSFRPTHQGNNVTGVSRRASNQPSENPGLPGNTNGENHAYSTKSG
jgi:hypothetical protein